MPTSNSGDTYLLYEYEYDDVNGSVPVHGGRASTSSGNVADGGAVRRSGVMGTLDGSSIFDDFDANVIEYGVERYAWKLKFWRGLSREVARGNKRRSFDLALGAIRRPCITSGRKIVRIYDA